jgi:hypothetical protein
VRRKHACRSDTAIRIIDTFFELIAKGSTLATEVTAKQMVED